MKIRLSELRQLIRSACSELNEVSNEINVVKFDDDKLDSNLDSNVKMLDMFPGSERGLRALFVGPGFIYDGKKIGFKTYLGLIDVVLDTFEGMPTISIDDPEGSYVWDPADESWSNLDQETTNDLDV